MVINQIEIGRSVAKVAKYSKSCIDKASGNENMADVEDGEYIIADLKFNGTEAELKLVNRSSKIKLVAPTT